MVRPENQDHVFAGQLPPDAGRHLFAVADGVGGREGGAWASERALQVLIEETARAGARLDEAFEAANVAVIDGAARNALRNGAATTLVAVLVEGSSYTWANVGDSRAYLFRAGDFQQLTTDHSLVEEEIAAGRMTREEARKSSYRNVITRSIGHDISEEVDCEGPFALEAGDVLLLCSDGLHGLVEDAEIAEHLRRSPPEGAAAALIDLANLRGGHDNISVVICSVEVAGSLREPVAAPEAGATDEVTLSEVPLATLAEPAMVTETVMMSRAELRALAEGPSAPEPEPAVIETGEATASGGSSFRLVGFGAAVLATAALLIALLRPF